MKIDNKDMNFSIIKSHFPAYDKNIEIDINELCEQIDINKLSLHKLEEFGSMWDIICNFILNKKEENEFKSESKHSTEVSEIIEFEGQSENRFDCIINHLRGEEKKNVCDSGIINVTSSSIFTKERCWL